MVLTVVTEVANSYIQLRALDRQLEIARSTSQTLAESARLQRIRFEGGAIPESDYRQAESQYRAAAAQVPDLERQIAKALSRMLLVSIGVHFVSFVSLPLVDEVRPPAGGRDRRLAIDSRHLPFLPSAISPKGIRKSLLLHCLRSKAGKSCLAGTAIALQQGRQGQLEKSTDERMGHGND